MAKLSAENSKDAFIKLSEKSALASGNRVKNVKMKLHSSRSSVFQPSEGPKCWNIVEFVNFHTNTKPAIRLCCFFAASSTSSLSSFVPTKRRQFFFLLSFIQHNQSAFGAELLKKEFFKRSNNTKCSSNFGDFPAMKVDFSELNFAVSGLNSTLEHLWDVKCSKNFVSGTIYTQLQRRTNYTHWRGWVPFCWTKKIYFREKICFFRAILGGFLHRIVRWIYVENIV